MTMFCRILVNTRVIALPYKDIMAEISPSSRCMEYPYSAIKVFGINWLICINIAPIRIGINTLFLKTVKSHKCSRSTFKLAQHVMSVALLSHIFRSLAFSSRSIMDSINDFVLTDSRNFLRLYKLPLCNMSFLLKRSKSWEQSLELRLFSFRIWDFDKFGKEDIYIKSSGTSFGTYSLTVRFLLYFTFISGVRNPLTDFENPSFKLLSTLSLSSGARRFLLSLNIFSPWLVLTSISLLSEISLSSTEEQALVSFVLYGRIRQAQTQKCSIIPAKISIVPLHPYSTRVYCFRGAKRKTPAPAPDETIPWATPRLLLK